MTTDTIEKTVRSFVVALMNGTLYYPEHRRVVEAVASMMNELDRYFEDQPFFLLAIRDNMIIIDGIPYYDLSIYSSRLIESLRSFDAWGVRFDRGVAQEEITALIKVFVAKQGEHVSEINSVLQEKEIVHVAFLEQPIGESNDAKRKKPSAPSVKALEFDNKVIGEQLYANALSVVQDIMIELQNSKHVSFSASRDVAEDLVHALRSNRTPFLSMNSVNDYDVFTYNHSLNVCLYTTSIAKMFIEETEELIQVAQAALMHDIGKLLMPENILYKAGKLTTEEWDIMQRHTVLGARMLLETEGVDELAVNVAYGHHLGYDRSGYPRMDESFSVDPITDLVNIVDVYEALTAKRSYKQSYPPEQVAKLLLEGAGTKFHPECVDVFLRNFGVFPCGTTVRLNDNSLATVLSINPLYPMHPLVKMVDDSAGEKVSGTEIIDTSESDANGDHSVYVVETVV